MYSSGGRTGFHMIASPWIQIPQNTASNLLRTYRSNAEYVAILRGYQTSNYMNLDNSDFNNLQSELEFHFSELMYWRKRKYEALKQIKNALKNIDQ